MDADLFFYQNPKIILNELKSNSVLITEHRYYPATNDHPSGKYCVQFIPFVNDLYGNRVISWWKTRCIEWCYLRAEDGKWADQGYLNDWPSLFEKIVVMENRGGGIANWNMDGHKFFKEKSILQAYNEETKSNIDVIFYHFQGVKIFNNGLISLGIYKRNMNVYNLIYKDYLNRLSEKENELISKIEISRDQFNYQDYPDSNFKYFFKLLRMYIFPKENDLINYYNFFKKYRWLH